MRRWLPPFFLLVFSCFSAEVIQAQGKPLSQIKLPSIEFDESDLPSALEYLSLKAKELGGQPSNFVVYDPLGTLSSENPTVSLSLNQVPLSVVLKYVTQLSRTTSLIDRRVVWIGKPADLQILRVRRSSRTSKVLATPTFKRLARIQIPEIDFSETTLPEVVDAFRQLDRAKGGPGNFVLIGGEILQPSDAKVNMKVSGLSLGELVQFSSELSNFRLRVDPHAIVFRAPDARVQPSHRSQSSLLRALALKRVEQVAVEDATLSEMIELIQYYSKSPALPNGVNIISLTKTEKTVSLDLKGARLIDVLRYINELTQTSFRVDSSAIQIFDLPPPPPKKAEKKEGAD